MQNNIEDLFFDKKDSGKIIYNIRYSETDEPDNRGRWSRKVMYNNLCIGWISMLIIDNKPIRYHLTTYFPSSSNDNPHSNYKPVKDTYKEAQEELELLWDNFVNKIK